MLLASTSDVIRLVTGSAVTTDVLAVWADTTTTAFTPGNTPTAITTATTTTLVAAPAASTFRHVKFLVIRNTHAATEQPITVQFYNGTTAFELWEGTLAAGESLQFTPEAGFVPVNVNGVPKMAESHATPTVNAISALVLSSDVTNNNVVANTIADVTGLSFSVVSGQTYWFEFVIPYTSAATTTGSRWSINGPAAPTLLAYRSEYTLTATTTTVNSATAYDIPAASNATSLTAGNVATIWGIIKPSSDGTVIARFASEVSASAVVAKAGATVRWMRVL